MGSVGVPGGELSSCFVGARGLRAGRSGTAPLPPKATASPAGTVPEKLIWGGVQRQANPGLSSPSGQPLVGFSLGEKLAPPVSRVVSGDFSGILGLLFQGVGWVRSDNLIATGYLLFFPLPCEHTVCS